MAKGFYSDDSVGQDRTLGYGVYEDIECEQQTIGSLIIQRQRRNGRWCLIIQGLRIRCGQVVGLVYVELRAG